MLLDFGCRISQTKLQVHVLFSYLMVSGAIDWNICTEILGMTKGSIARGHRPSAICLKG
jgi:hypothetical protein